MCRLLGRLKNIRVDYLVNFTVDYLVVNHLGVDYLVCRLLHVSTNHLVTQKQQWLGVG